MRLNPIGVVALFANLGRNPVGVGSSRCDGPRVARSSQPLGFVAESPSGFAREAAGLSGPEYWALLRNPFGTQFFIRDAGNDQPTKERSRAGVQGDGVPFAATGA